MVLYKCDASVKTSVKSFHKKCDDNRPPVQMIGNDLNTALGIIDFEPNEKCKIFRSLYNHKIQPTLK